VEVKTPTTLAERVEVVRRRDAFDRDPKAFAATWADADAEVRDRLLAARARVRKIETPTAVLEAASRLCMATQTDGLRGELTILRAARAFAALKGAKTLNEGHIREIAAMALRHRLRRNPLDEGGSTIRIERAMNDTFVA
jgi:magnesium chelatase subunit I